MQTILVTTGLTLVCLLAGAGLLHLLPPLGSAGRALSEALCRAPLLDFLVTYFTVLPPIVGGIVVGWQGVLGGIAGQVATLFVWSWLHELFHPEARRGPRIVKENNRLVGRFQNHAGLWISSLAVPVFWLLRLTELVVYPFLIVLLRFPRYKQGDWVNLSRHKFQGLVGHDLIWCLYCDWMTGLWSLGSEMLRNLESFWCPIRFHSDKKCDNCALDFPDINNSWVAADASMTDVTELIKRRYSKDDPPNAWHGYRTPLTIERKPLDEDQS